MSIEQAALNVTAEVRAAFLDSAARLQAAARARGASRTEFELALGVLVALSRGATPAVSAPL